MLGVAYGLSFWFYLNAGRPQDRPLLFALFTLPAGLLAWMLWADSVAARNATGQAEQPRRRRAVRPYAAALLVLIGVASPFSLLALHTVRSLLCERQLIELAVSMETYMDDHKALPPAEGWADALYPEYLHDRSVFFCPESGGKAGSYAFNAALSTLPRHALPTPAHVVLLYETDHGGWNAAGGVELLPARPRHRVGMYLVPADDRAFWPRAVPLAVAKRLRWKP